MYISILLIEKKSIYFLFKNCEKAIKIQNETAPLNMLPKAEPNISNPSENIKERKIKSLKFC